MSQTPEQPAAGDATLAQAWREASRDAPAPALDEAIRAAARKAVQSRPRPAGVSPFGGRWRVPLSVAALVIVSATVTLLVAERDWHGVLHDQAAAPPAARSGQSETSAVVPASPAPFPRQFAERVTPAPAARGLAPREQSQQAAPPVLEERKRQASPSLPASTEQPQARVQSDARLMRPAPVTEADQSATQPVQSDQPQAAAAAPAAAPMRRDQAASNAASPVPTDEATSGLAKREEQPTGKAKERRAEEAAGAAPPAMPQTGREPAAEAAEPRAMTRAAPAAKTSVQTPATAQSLEPKAWLDRIAELRRQGKLQEAEENLKAFRERYPDYPLPAELKNLP